MSGTENGTTGRGTDGGPVAETADRRPGGALRRRGFLAGAGALGGAVAVGGGMALTEGRGHAAVPPRPDLMTAALGTPLADLPGATEAARSKAGTVRADPAVSRALRAARQLTPFRDPLPIPRVLRGRKGQLTVSLREARLRLHSALPPTRLWTYEGTHVGPTIEARSGRRLRIAWENDLDGEFPVPAVRVPFAYDPALPLMWDRPGREGATARADVARLPPWAAVHLHGAITGGGNDGWAENAVLPGAAQLAEYPHQQPAAGLWYHDHAMHITHLNVMTGLGSGSYLIRDEEEAELRLPSGDREIPLVVFDRNLDVDDEGALTGGLLYKGIVVIAEPYQLVRPFTGPFNLVNGVIWPHLEVAAGWYRFRVLNASNSRPYLLKVLDEDGTEVPSDALVMIGTDAGLLPRPAPVAGGVPLTPGERADLLVDFSRFRGQRLRLVNDSPEPGIRPDLMQFRVGSRADAGGFAPPAVLAASFRPPGPAETARATERLVVVTPVYPKDPELWEMVETGPPSGPLPIDGIIQIEEADGTVRTFQRVSATFHDPVRFTVPSGATERWTFLSLERSPGAYPHPMHLHAVAFQGVSREVYDVSSFAFFEQEGGGYGAGTTRPLRRTGGRSLTAAEQGPKDVIRLAPAERLTVVARFDGPPGRFMHHCHTYEHEDMMMMRPFLVQPKAVLDLAPHGGGSGPGAHH